MPTELQAHIDLLDLASSSQESALPDALYSTLILHLSHKNERVTPVNLMVGLERFELSYDRYERSVLPLDDSPIRKERGIVSRMAMPDHYDIGFGKGSRTPIDRVKVCCPTH